MSARWFALAALVAAPALAEEAGGQQAGDRPGVAALADRFEHALVAGDARVLPLAEDFAYVENGAPLLRAEGMWRTLTALEGDAYFPDLDYRFELVDGDAAYRVVKFEENGVRGVMAYRLVARDGQIARIDVLPVREEFGGDRGGTLTLLQPTLLRTMDGALVGPSALDGTVGGTVSDARMRAQVEAYFAAYGHDGADPAADLPDFARSCARYDNGQRATGVEDSQVLDPAMPEFRPFALGCEAQLASGFYANYTSAALDIVTDLERGVALAHVRLDQPGTRLAFEAPGLGAIAYPGPRGPDANSETGEQFDGRILTNMISPMSVNGVFVFAFDRDGAIARIESFYRGAPLGWDAVPD